MATSVPAPSATATWHEESVFSQTPRQESAEDLFCRSAGVWNHVHVSRDQHRLERGGYRPADKRIHPKLGHTLCSTRGPGFLNARFLAADLAIAVNVD
jgi:hypothetical protein